MRTPKRYECIDCGAISSRQRTVRIGSIGFATCHKCGGKVKEREVWLDWLNTERNKSMG